MLGGYRPVKVLISFQNRFIPRPLPIAAGIALPPRRHFPHPCLAKASAGNTVAKIIPHQQAVVCVYEPR